MNQCSIQRAGTVKDPQPAQRLPPVGFRPVGYLFLQLFTIRQLTAAANADLRLTGLYSWNELQQVFDGMMGVDSTGTNAVNDGIVNNLLDRFRRQLR